MKVYNGSFLTGLRMLDNDGKIVVNQEWSEDGEWMPWKTIPDGHEIIGLKWHYRNEWIARIGFILWRPNGAKE